MGKNQSALASLWAQQEAGRFVMEYGAVTADGNSRPRPPGFPPPPEPPLFPAGRPCRIASYFRPYGPGRKAVRPVREFRPGKEIAGDQGRPYETEIIETAELEHGRRYFVLRIIRGFRHQIRCHLAWIGNPIAGDSLYGDGGPADSVKTADSWGAYLALRAQALCFRDPRTGAPREFRIPAVNNPAASGST
jgi:23S rRNA pseudouridine1911/1915/1917 synthase